MKTFHTEIPATLGSLSIPTSVKVSYRFLPRLSATRIDPGCGGVELVQITADGQNVEWTDEPWIDDLIQEIYAYEEAA